MFFSHVRRPRTIAGLALLTALTAACSATTDSEPVAGDGSEIIGGVTTNDPAFDAVGVLGAEMPASWVGIEIPEGGEDPLVFRSYCTGTLISPTTVLTAKHCVIDDKDPRNVLDQIATLPIQFALGPNPHQEQTVKVRVAAVTLAKNLGKDGFIGSVEGGLATDVALVTLAEPITSVAPLRVAKAPLRTKDVGSVLTIVGYGNHDDYLATGNPEAAGERRVASIPLRATQGAGLKTVYPTFDAYFESLQRVYGYPNAIRPVVQTWYSQHLVKDYEVMAGGKKYDASGCFGDSGGPVFRREGGAWVVRAVVSGVLDSNALECNGPNIYANMGPEVQALLAQKDDPCLGIPTEGRCTSGAVVQCKVDSGVRKAELIDCASAGGTCGLDANGHAACGVAPTEHAPRTCNALKAPEGTPVQPVEIAANAPLPKGGRLLDGDYVLEKDERYLGPGAPVAPVEGEELIARFRVKNGKLNAVSSNGMMPGMRFDRGFDARRGDGATIGATIVARGAAWLDVQTTCPWTESHNELAFTASGNRLVLFKYPKKGRVEVGTYRRVAPKP